VRRERGLGGGADGHRLRDATRVLALLYDVHGNLPALEAVLADADAAGARRWVLGGDYALFGGWPAEAVARLRGLGDAATWIRGNVDRWAGAPRDAPDDPTLQAAIAACRAALGEAEAGRLGALPFEHREGSTRFVHASPVSDLRSFQPEPAEDEPELLAAAGEGVARLVFGHTHLAFRRVAGDVELVNPGSVGIPLDGDPRAAYALVDDDGRVEHRRVAYDHAASAARVRALGAWAEPFARRIATARA